MGKGERDSGGSSGGGMGGIKSRMTPSVTNSVNRTNPTPSGGAQMRTPGVPSGGVIGNAMSMPGPGSERPMRYPGTPGINPTPGPPTGSNPPGATIGRTAGVGPGGIGPSQVGMDNMAQSQGFDPQMFQRILQQIMMRPY